MRYIGNKTKLLPFILGTLDRLGIAPGRAHDAFAGTASVGGALHRWRAAGLVGDDEYYILLAALLEGADRAANTAGVYAAYIKRWQGNARRRVAVIPTVPLAGPRGSTAHRDDATRV